MKENLKMIKEMGKEFIILILRKVNKNGKVILLMEKWKEKGFLLTMKEKKKKLNIIKEYKLNEFEGFYLFL